MWDVKSVEIENLMSFSDAVYEIKKGVVTTIYGDNRDNDSQQSNGSGKSALLEAIAIGLTAGTLRKIKNGEVVKNGEKACRIILTLTNSSTKELMEITRHIFPKKSAVVEININGEPVKDLTTADSANQFILDKIGIGREDLLNYFILSNTRFEPFLNASDTKKKETINRFSNGAIVDGAIEELEKDLEDAQAEFDEKSTQVRVIEGKIEVTKESIREALSEEEVEEKPDDKIAKYKADQDNSRESLKSAEEEKGKLEKSISSKKSEFNRFDKDQGLNDLRLDFDDTKSEYDEIIAEITGKSEELTKLRSRVKSIKVQLEGTVSCPKCTHEFDVVDKGFDPDKAKKELDDLVKSEEEIISQGKSLNKEKKEVELELSEIEDEITELNSKKEVISSDIIDLENELSTIGRKISNLNYDIEHFDVMIDNVGKVTKKSDPVAPLKKKVAELEKQLKPLAEELEEVKQEVEEFTVQKDLFKRFKTHLANKSIRSIEILTNDNLEAIGSDISIKISGISKLASGKTRDKIDATLVRDGVELGSFNKNSNGEKTRVNLATILTFNKLINLNAGDGKGLNLLAIDEILDASDATGLMAMIRAMNKLEVTVLMVSHGAVSENYEHSITVVKEGGESKIIE